MVSEEESLTYILTYLNHLDSLDTPLITIGNGIIMTRDIKDPQGGTRASMPLICTGLKVDIRRTQGITPHLTRPNTHPLFKGREGICNLTLDLMGRQISSRRARMQVMMSIA
jgi:hypothetical protein